MPANRAWTGVRSPASPRFPPRRGHASPPGNDHHQSGPHRIGGSCGPRGGGSWRQLVGKPHVPARRGIRGHPAHRTFRGDPRPRSAPRCTGSRPMGCRSSIREDVPVPATPAANKLEIIGADRPGIVREITSALARGRGERRGIYERSRQRADVRRKSCPKPRPAAIARPLRSRRLENRI